MVHIILMFSQPDIYHHGIYYEHSHEHHHGLQQQHDHDNNNLHHVYSGACVRPTVIKILL